MSHNKDLKAQYPDLDLTQSTYSDMLKAHENSKSKTHAALKNMQKELQQEKENKVKELQEQFTAIPRSIIVQTLESVKWDVDTAIVPLFTILEEYQRPQEVELIKQYELAQSKLPRPEDKEVKITTVKVEEVKEEVVYENKENPFKVETTNTTTSEKEQQPQKTGTLKASPDNVDVGNTVAVEWQIINGTTSSYDWIGLYQIDQPNKQYLTYEWRGSGELNGTLTFKAPTTYGTYEFRYIPYGSYNHVAKSNPIQVGPQVNLTATLTEKKIKCNWNVKVGNQYSWAWVGLYEKSQKNNKNYITWQYANKVSELTFDAPVKPTEYELRYFVYGYNDVARSNTIKVEGKDTLEAIVKDAETISAKVSIVTLDPYYDSVWIGLYSTSEENNRNIKRYKWITERETEVTFRAPESGEYEFRLFANKSYDMKLKSNSIKIEQPQQ